MGWFPDDFGLKDHSIFYFDSYYYLISNLVPNEKEFVYARSVDLCNWEQLGPVLSQRVSGTWDEMAVWAPHVFVENGTFYLYFTGVTKNFTQSIMLATTDNPAEPESWQIQAMVFQPNHPGMNWQADGWADCRDPMVIKVEDIYYLYYTGRDGDYGIVGLATATTPVGPWEDWGAISTLSTPYAMPESATVARYMGLFYLFYHDTSQGERYRVGASPGGPWSQSEAFHPGIAHEFWKTQEGKSYTSYLTSYSVTISPFIWDTHYDPPQPFIGSTIYRLSIPVVIH